MEGGASWRAVALRDLREAYEFLAQDSPEAAERLLDATEKAVDLLLENPSAGRLRRFRSPRVRGIRSWAVRGFSNYLIFYRVTAGDVDVVRFLHGARDLPRFLEASE